jgi:hypothetical protein
MFVLVTNLGEKLCSNKCDSFKFSFFREREREITNFKLVSIARELRLGKRFLNFKSFGIFKRTFEKIG